MTRRAMTRRAMTGHAMTGPQPLGPQPLGPLIHSFFLDHLATVKGLRPASVRSNRC